MFIIILDSLNGLTYTCSYPQNMQIVTLRVSMHCYGCAKKVEKHISKLEGEHITFFSPHIIKQLSRVI